MSYIDHEFDDPASDSKPPRRKGRRDLEARGHLLRAGGRIVDVELKDLSYDGCRIDTPEYLWQGERLKLSVPRQGVIEAEVRWCRGGSAGLRFEPEKVAEPEQVERREVRLAAMADVTLRRVGISAYRVTVRDISRQGCKVELVERPKAGETVMVKFDGFDAMVSRVQWIDGFVAGVAFERPIHPSVFDILIARLGASA